MRLWKAALNISGNDERLVEEKEFFDATWDRVVLVKILFLKNQEKELKGFEGKKL